MGFLKLTDEAAPATPASATTTLYFDATVLPVLRTTDDAGNDKQVAPIGNSSTVGQTPVASTRTYLTGSNITIPTAKAKVGAIYRCKFAMTKTAAGVATSTIDVAVGTAGTTADTARCSFTKPVGTAAVDEGWVQVEVVIKTIGASGVIVGECWVIHNGNAAGHMTIPVAVLQNTSGTFDLTVANLIFGTCITTGAADAITISQCQSELVNC